MNFRRILPAFLLLCTVMGTAASCGGDSTQPAETTAAVVGGDVTGAVTEAVTDDRAPLNLPEADFGGESLRFLEYDFNTFVRYHDFAYAEDSAGELVNDAVFARNSMIEERYNCKIESQLDADPVAMTRKFVTAGADDYDVAELYINNAMTMAMEGMFLNWYELPSVNMKAEWWDQEIQRDLAMYNKIYVMTGDISLFDEELNFCVYFSKKTAENYDIPDLYQLVRDDQWTLEKMHTLGKSVSADLNGDGVRDEHDRFGVLTNADLLHLYFYASGCSIVTLDDNGVPGFSVDNERAMDAAARWLEFLNDSDTVLWASRCSDTWTTLDRIYMEDRTLFRPGSIFDIQTYRSMNGDFGILPYPKLDETQEEYSHIIASAYCPALCIPTTNTGIDRTGFLLEALAYESRDTVTEAYYDVNLYTKMTRDDESGEMLDIIFSTKRYDLGWVFDWGGIVSAMDTIGSSGKTFASVWESRKKQAVSAMEKTLEFYSTGD